VTVSGRNDTTRARADDGDCPSGSEQLPIPRRRTTGRSLLLPRRGRLPKTGDVDFVNSYYGLGIGWVMRSRLRWVRDALPAGGVPDLLEIGYGSGIFFYELARHADRITGVEVHEAGGAVARHLRCDGIAAHLVRASGMVLPFADASFDVVVLMSALEFMPDPAACVREAIRVLRPGGRIVGIRPRQLPAMDRVFRLLSGVDPESDFRGGRERVWQALHQPGLRVVRRPRPQLAPRALAPYELFIIRRAPSGAAAEPRSLVSTSCGS
jgi:SAM-dependent methyltransferase